MSEVDTSEEVKVMLLDIVKAAAKGSDHAVTVSALCLAIHYFCEATDYTIDSFITNLKHLRDRDNESTNNPTVKG